MSENIITLRLVFPTLWAASAGRWGLPWPPLSSACHWSPPRRWCHALLHTAPSRLLSIPPTLQRPTRSPSSSPPSARCGCSLAWVLPPQHGGLKSTTTTFYTVCCVSDFKCVLPSFFLLNYLLASPWWTRFFQLCQDQPSKRWLSYKMNA